MKKFTEITTHFLSFFGIAFSMQDLSNILNIILLIISIVNILIVLILNIVNWYKKAHEDGVITKEEQKELRTLIQDASEDIKEETGKLPHNDKN